MQDLQVNMEADSCLCVMQPQVLLLDEVTVDLDVVTRLDLLDFLKEECDEVNFMSHLRDGYV